MMRRKSGKGIKKEGSFHEAGPVRLDLQQFQML